METVFFYVKYATLILLNNVLTDVFMQVYVITFTQTLLEVLLYAMLSVSDMKIMCSLDLANTTLGPILYYSYNPVTFHIDK